MYDDFVTREKKSKKNSTKTEKKENRQQTKYKPKDFVYGNRKVVMTEENFPVLTPSGNTIGINTNPNKLTGRFDQSKQTPVPNMNNGPKIIGAGGIKTNSNNNNNTNANLMSKVINNPTPVAISPNSTPKVAKTEPTSTASKNDTNKLTMLFDNKVPEVQAKKEVITTGWRKKGFEKTRFDYNDEFPEL